MPVCSLMCHSLLFRSAMGTLFSLLGTRIQMFVPSKFLKRSTRCVVDRQSCTAIYHEFVGGVFLRVCSTELTMPMATNE